jgi:hypothetical protein
MQYYIMGSIILLLERREQCGVMLEEEPLQWAIKRLACCVNAGEGGEGESCRGELEEEG